MKDSITPKIHVIVLKNVVPKATKRNLIKRRLRYAIKTLFKPALKKQTLFLYAKKGIESLSYQEIAREVRILIKNSKP